MSTVTLTAYNVKTKEKNVPMVDAVISKTAKGAYMAQGHDGKGNKLTTLLGEEKALRQPSKPVSPNKAGKSTLDFTPVINDSGDMNLRIAFS